MRYQSKHSMLRVVRSLSVKLRITILAGSLAVAGVGTTFAVSAASASTTTNASNIAAAQNVGTTTSNTLVDATNPPVEIITGGSFVSNATAIGTMQIGAAGTYMINFNAKATPNAVNSAQVFPQFFVYSQVKNSSFTGDLFNIGAGALESPTLAELPNDVIDSYYSGSDVITVPSGGETLYFYAFGYDSNTGGGTYNLDSATATAIRLAG